METPNSSGIRKSDLVNNKRASGLKAFALAAGTLWQREIIRFFRQPSRIIGSLATPLMFWIFIGSGIGTSFRPEGVAPGAVSNYLQFFFPGILLLIVMFSTIFASYSLIEDRNNGFLQGALVTPAARGSIVIGKILGGATLGVLQGLVFMALAPFAGITIHLVSGFEIALILFLLSFTLTGIGFILAWPMESSQGFHSISSIVLYPMWLMSGALFPASGAAGWIKVLMYLNPVSYGFNLLQKTLNPSVAGLDLPVWGSFLVISLFAMIIFVGAWILACKRKTSQR